MSEHVRVIFGVPYKVGKGFEAILDEYGIKELDTGASYVSSTTVFFTLEICLSLCSPVRKQ